MNRSRKSCLLLLGILGIPILLFFLYLLISSFFSRTETYYIPQLNMYVKTIIKPRDKYGYILFGNNPNITLSDSIDYISVYKNISNSVIINPYKKDTIWFYSQIKKDILNEGQYTIMNRPKGINKSKFVIIDGINEKDSLFFYKRYLTNPIAIKEPYLEISVEFTDYILIQKDSTTIRIYPLK